MSGTSMDLVTPVEPASAQLRPAAGAAGTTLMRLGPFAHLTVASASICGSAHSANEDAHSNPGASNRLFVVADGVGGGALPGVASSALVARLHETLPRRAINGDVLAEALLEADMWVAGELERSTQEQGAATVAVCARASASGALWWLGWVGDCRIYRVGGAAGGEAEQLTCDDTYRMLQETPPTSGSPDDPARMVGNGAVIRPNVRKVRLAAGEMLVLCSDGLHKQVSAREIAAALRAGGEALEQHCMQLARLAHERGSDDATLLVVRREVRSRVRAAATALAAASLALALALWLQLGGPIP